MVKLGQLWVTGVEPGRDDLGALIGTSDETGKTCGQRRPRHGQPLPGQGTQAPPVGDLKLAQESGHVTLHAATTTRPAPTRSLRQLRPCSLTRIREAPTGDALPPKGTTASMPRISGSAKAALTSAARAAGVAPTSRVVGYSTGISPVSSVSRRITCSCTSGNAPAAANEGERTAMRSPGRAFGWTRSSVIPEIQAHRTA
jgi:hypothetical protein